MELGDSDDGSPSPPPPQQRPASSPPTPQASPILSSNAALELAGDETFDAALNRAQSQVRDELQSLRAMIARSRRHSLPSDAVATTPNPPPTLSAPPTPAAPPQPPTTPTSVRDMASAIEGRRLRRSPPAALGVVPLAPPRPPDLGGTASPSALSQGANLWPSASPRSMPSLAALMTSLQASSAAVDDAVAGMTATSPASAPDSPVKPGRIIAPRAASAGHTPPSMDLWSAPAASPGGDEADGGGSTSPPEESLSPPQSPSDSSNTASLSISGDDWVEREEEPPPPPPPDHADPGDPADPDVPSPPFRPRSNSATEHASPQVWRRPVDDARGASSFPIARLEAELREARAELQRAKDHEWQEIKALRAKFAAAQDHSHKMERLMQRHAAELAAEQERAASLLTALEAQREASTDLEAKVAALQAQVETGKQEADTLRRALADANSAAETASDRLVVVEKDKADTVAHLRRMMESAHALATHADEATHPHHGITGGGGGGGGDDDLEGLSRRASAAMAAKTQELHAELDRLAAHNADLVRQLAEGAAAHETELEAVEARIEQRDTWWEARMRHTVDEAKAQAAVDVAEAKKASEARVEEALKEASAAAARAQDTAVTAGVAHARAEYEQLMTEWEAQTEAWRQETVSSCEQLLTVARAQLDDARAEARKHERTTRTQSQELRWLRAIVHRVAPSALDGSPPGTPPPQASPPMPTPLDPSRFNDVPSPAATSPPTARKPTPASAPAATRKQPSQRSPLRRAAATPSASSPSSPSPARRPSVTSDIVQEAVGAMSVAALRALLSKAGVPYEDCVEKAELRQRLLDAVESGKLLDLGSAAAEAAEDLRPRASRTKSHRATPSSTASAPAGTGEGHGGDGASSDEEGHFRNWATATAPDGQVYYYHKITRAVRWEKPAKGMAKRVEERIAAEQAAVQQRQKERVAALAAKDKEERAAARAKDKLEGLVERRVVRWSTGKDLPALLRSLPAMYAGRDVPDGIAAAAAGAGAAGADLKKAYLKAIRCVHPDKVATAPLEQQLLAKRLFAVLSEAYQAHTEGGRVKKRRGTTGASPATTRRRGTYAARR